MSAWFSIPDILKATGGRLAQQGRRDTYVGVSTDSRTCQEGQIFIPLPGERFDGHDFIGRALARQAGAVIVRRDWWQRQGRALAGEVTAITVDDTLGALGDLAASWRRRFAMPVAGITGSCGKTTTKEMTALVVGEGYRVWKNDMNINNLVGVPQTLLGLNGEHEAAVIEMGMNNFGEIRRLAAMVQPTIGVLTNVYPAHTEGLGSVAGVARAKGELLEALGPEHLLIYNRDDCFLAELAARFPGRKLSYGLEAAADLHARRHRPLGLTGQEVDFCYRGHCWPALIRVVGLHHLYNALAAAAVGLALGLGPEAIAAGLGRFASLDKRTQVTTLKCGAHLINDCYNANPGSMGQALRTLAQVRNQGRAVAMLGDMLELGAATEEAHGGIGGLAAELDLDLLVVCGDFRHHVAQGAQEAGLPAGRIVPVASQGEGARILEEFLGPGDVLLVKGSRGMRLEKLVAALT